MALLHLASSRLPQELCDLVIDQHAGDNEMLSCLSLVCRGWMFRCRYHLFKYLEIYESTRQRLFTLLESPLATILRVKSQSVSLAVTSLPSHAICSIFHNLTTLALSLRSPTSLRFSSVASLLLAFPFLKRLTLQRIPWLDDTSSSPTKPLPLLESLALQELSMSPAISLLTGLGGPLQLHLMYIERSEEPSTLNRILKRVGPRLQHLTLHWPVGFDSSRYLECLSLNSNTNLRSVMVIPPFSTRPWSQSLMACLSSLRSSTCHLEQLALSVHFSSIVQSEWMFLDRQLTSLVEKGLASVMIYLWGSVDACNRMLPVITSYLRVISSRSTLTLINASTIDETWLTLSQTFAELLK